MCVCVWVCAALFVQRDKNGKLTHWVHTYLVPRPLPTPVSWPWRSPPVSEACQRNISSRARASKEKLNFSTFSNSWTEFCYIKRYRSVKKWQKDLNSVADPDPYVFGPPGSVSGSSSTSYGFYGSFYNQAKIVRKTLIPTRYCFVTSLWLFIFYQI